MDIYKQIDTNKKKTATLIFLFIAFFCAIGFLFGYFFNGGDIRSGIAMLVPAFSFSAISSVTSYYFSDKMVLSMHNAKSAAEVPGTEIYQSMVENLCKVAQVPPAKLYIQKSNSLNAFATGRNPEKGVVCLTTGIIEALDKDELEGVIAHEIAHIKNYDIRLMTVVAVLVGSIALISDWLIRGRFHTSNDEDQKGFNYVAIILSVIAALLTPIIAQIIQMAISRRREYLADATGAYLTRYPQGLASALEKISSSHVPLESANRATAHMYISNPFKGKKMASFFSTHPPAVERIKRLRNM